VLVIGAGDVEQSLGPVLQVQRQAAATPAPPGLHDRELLHGGQRAAFSDLLGWRQRVPLSTPTPWKVGGAAEWFAEPADI